mmetsp:Transcript_3260/g.7596  ORF Transcript_3260/g.7596 Transcript_3260/m.7596 type:complete len:406 (+) Transcript_3260:323-1540(+)
MAACAGKQSASLQRLYRHVDLTSHFCELLAHLFHALLQDSLAINITVTTLFCILAHIVGDLHGAKLWAAHGAEVCRLALLRVDGLVMHAPCSDGIQGEIELVVPAELKAGLGERVIPLLGLGMTLGEVGSMGRDAVGDDAGLHILTVWQTQVFLRSDVAQHCRPHGTNVGRTDSGGDVVVARSDVCSQGAQRVERRLVAPLQLLLHVLRNLVQRHVAWPFVHHLDAFGPRPLGQLALHLQFAELGLVVGILDATGTKAITDAQRHVVFLADVQNVIPVLVGKVFLMLGDAKLRMDRAPTADDAREALRRQRHESQQYPSVDGPIIDTLLGLLDQRLTELFPSQVLSDAVDLLKRLVDGHRSHGHGAVSDDPLPRLVDVLARAQVHQGVGAPKGAPLQLLDFLLDV